MSNEQLYKQKPRLVKAIQWDKANPEKTLEYLSESGIGYTYHEIASASELFIYTVGQTLQVNDREWIVISGSHIDTMDNDTFNDSFEEHQSA